MIQMIDTSVSVSIDSGFICSYFSSLVNKFYKILPMRENCEQTTDTYIKSLQIELLGLGAFTPDVQQRSDFVSLLSVLQYFADNPNCDIKDVRREVFRSINMCKHLSRIYNTERR